MELLKFAAVDIGSNAVRLLVNTIIDEDGNPYFKKASLIRVPIRLGADVFKTGKISKENIKRLTEAMQAYKLLMQVHGVTDYRAFATSAMREASNGKKVAEMIRKETGVDLQIIDGMIEAELLFATRMSEQLNPAKSYLYVDVGGGSTELTLFSDNKSQASKSFKIGTIRILNEQVGKDKWSALEEWLLKTTKNIKQITVIGTGGNVNKLSKILNGKKRDKSFVRYKDLRELYDELAAMSVEERMRQYSMRSDRADVVVPAAHIFTTVMETTKAKEMFVPKVGLSDGMIRWMYRKYKR